MMSLRDIRRNGRRRGKGEEGQALVEMALVMPFLLLLITAAIQFGIMLSDYSTLVNAARLGARELALGRTESDPCDPAVKQAIASASGQLAIPSGDITPSFPLQATAGTDYCGTNSSCTYVYDTSCNSNGAEIEGDDAEITIKYPYTLKVFGLGILSLNLTTTSTNAVE
jgi:Flp pilus assembly protein TadG